MSILFSSPEACRRVASVLFRSSEAYLRVASVLFRSPEARRRVASVLFRQQNAKMLECEFSSERKAFRIDYANPFSYKA